MREKETVDQKKKKKNGKNGKKIRRYVDNGSSLCV